MTETRIQHIADRFNQGFALCGVELRDDFIFSPASVFCEACGVERVRRQGRRPQ